MATKHPDYEAMSVDELRELAKRQHISGSSHMKKDELIAALRGSSEGGTRENGGGKEAEHDLTSKSVKYAKWINSPDEHEDRPGQTLVTRNHDVIRQWAEQRNAKPASIKGSHHDDHLGVLRFNFPGYAEGGNLVEVSWDDWFRTFDERKLNFIYQEHRSDGKLSNFFRLDSPDREDG